MKWLLWVILLLFMSLASAEQRYALLIANQNYPTPQKDLNIFGALETPVPEMVEFAKVLENYGFEVTPVKNADLDKMSSIINQFIRKLQPGDEALFYYAGHGVQVDGKNYLIPIGKNFADAVDVKNGSYLAQNIIDKLSGSSARVKLVFLDSCRNQLLLKEKARGFGELGFTKMDAKGIIISYATALGEIAADNVTYTSQLIKAIQTHSNEPIEVMLSEAQALTARATGGQQIPWYEKGMVGTFCFGRCGKQENNATELERLREENELLKHQQANVQAPVVTSPATPQQVRSFRDTLNDGSLGPEFVQLPGGTFQMGSNDGDSDEKPVHTVTVKSFGMGKYEVTRGEFRKFVEKTNYRTDAEKEGGCYEWTGSEWKKNSSYHWKNVGYAQDDSHPVVCVSWNDAKAYVEWLSDQTGKDYRLPSEAQWEYAVRAGSTTKYFWGDDVKKACRYANVADQKAKGQFNWTGTVDCNDGYIFTSPVGKYEANRFGLHDMTGNVWEWNEDVWHGNYEGAPVDGSAWVAGGESKYHLIRVGSWSFDDGRLRCANRDGGDATDWDSFGGFRLSRM